MGLGLGMGLDKSEFGGGLSLSSEAKALFLRMSTQPTKARKVLIDNTIIALKNAG